MFPYEPPLSQHVDDPGIKHQVGDIRQPWVDLGNQCKVSEFAAKALFSLGMMRRYVLCANAVLKHMRHRGFPSAYGLLTSGIELLGRCIHPAKKVRQHPVSCSGDRLEEGFNYIGLHHLPAGVIVKTNHYSYSSEDLKHLRNLVVHGACITRASLIKGDIELLHELRRAFYCVPAGEIDPGGSAGPIKGALDRYYEALASGDRGVCEKLATAAISPVPLQLQQGAWPFDIQVVNETRQLVQENLDKGNFPISGGHTKVDDNFQLYP